MGLSTTHVCGWLLGTAEAGARELLSNEGLKAAFDRMVRCVSVWVWVSQWACVCVTVCRRQFSAVAAVV